MEQYPDDEAVELIGMTHIKPPSLEQELSSFSISLSKKLPGEVADPHGFPSQDGFAAGGRDGCAVSKKCREGYCVGCG